MYKIAHIITRIDTGGSAEDTIAVTARLNKHRYGCVLVTGLISDPDKHITNYLAQQGISYVVIPSLMRAINPIHDVKALWELYRFFKRENFSLVHTHSSKAGIIGRWAAWSAGVPVIVHTPHGHVFYGYFGRLKSFVFILIEKLTAYITDVIITLTLKGIDDHLRYRIAPAKKFTSIHSGVDVNIYRKLPESEREAVRAELGISGTQKVAGTVTRLEPVKNNRMILEAVARVATVYPDIALVIVGDGSERAMLAAYAIQLGIQAQVRFAGLRDDVPRLMSIFDVFVLGSLNEGLGMVLIQAQAMGVPVVATRVGGVEDIVIHEKTGLLVPAQDSETMASSLLRFLTDPILANQYGSEGKKWVTGTEQGLARFSTDLAVHKLENVYMTLLN